MNFRIGQKVVCVDFTGFSGLERHTVDGKIHSLAVPAHGVGYTIREFTECDGLRLEEIVNPVCVSILDGATEPSFRASRFRPLVERKTETGMAILREILERESHQDKRPVRHTVHS